MNFNGKIVWVTGAYQGIGKAIAQDFAKRGAKVLGFDRQFSELKKDGEREGEFEAIYLDLSQRSHIDQVLRQTLSKYPRIDVLVNSAGILNMGTVETLSYEAWDESLAVNLSGVFALLKHAVPVFKQQRHGAIVTIGSNASHVPRIEMAGYGAAKAALKSLSHSVALELAPYGVRCNLVSPGSTDTAMLRSMWQSQDESAKVIAGAPDQYRLGIPLGKVATAHDIANLVVFLASDLAGHITLQDIVVDGGATLGA